MTKGMVRQLSNFGSWLHSWSGNLGIGRCLRFEEESRTPKIARLTDTSDDEFGGQPEGGDEGGLVLVIKIFTGKKINEASIFPSEDEALLPPDTQFVVTSSPEEFEYTDVFECTPGKNAYITVRVWVVNLIEIHGEKMWS